MACVLNTIAHFIDVASVRKHLFPIDHPSDTDDINEDSWAWPEDSTSQKDNVDEKTISWLQDCKISLSSTGELLVIAHGISMVILTSKWNFQEEGDVKTKYHITWHGNPCQGHNEQITSVLCLPLLSQGKSSHCGTDWTCIVVGFSTGYIRFYTENCSLLITEMLHNEKVLYLKCQSYQPLSSSTCQEPTEELYVTYSYAVCIIPGFGLFQTLRACRNQLARVQANCGERVQAPPLAFKKLGFQDQSVMGDCEVAGPATANTFDHLLTASICGGFNTWYRSSAPQTSLVVAAGKKPFVAFHYALEGGAPPVLADVAKVMANKLKSAIGAVPSWLLGSRKSQPPDKSMEITIEPAEAMGCRFGLCDAWREGCQIVLAPHRALCVVCDTLGRIILIDTHKGVGLRMWKGYRDAQCGWLEVKEDSPHRSNIAQQKVALFLVIYSPKKGIIEVWTMQQGPRIATFPVSKNGRLVYTNYGLMGLNNTHLKGGNKSQSPCVFIDPVGIISEIVVPFHFALSAKNSKRVRDLHLLKKLKSYIKEQEYDNDGLCEEVHKTVEDLRTVEIRIQALETLSSNKFITPGAMQAALQVIAQQQASSSSTQEESGGKTLASLTSNLQCLVSFYSRMCTLNEKPPCYDSTLSEELLPEMLTTHLCTPPEERARILNLHNTLELMINKEKPPSAARVTFGDGGNRGAFVEFLSCFDLGCPNIHVKSGTNEEKLMQVGRVMLEGALAGADLDEWSAAVSSSCVEPMDLVQLAIRYWLSHVRPTSLQQNIAKMLRLAELMKIMCQMAGKKVVLAASNQISPWWQEVRDTLTRSTNPWGALTAAVVCRSVALPFEREGVAADDHCDWEHVSFDTCQWGILIARLEDVALLAAVITQHLEYETNGTSEKTDVSLEAMLARGKGAVTELAAGWLATWVQEPSILLESQSQVEVEDTAEKGGIKDGFKLPQEEGSDVVKLSSSSIGTSSVLNSIKVCILHQHFPYSMGNSILLANVCWEHVVAWSRGVSEVTRLENAVACLEKIPSPHLRRGMCCLIWSMHLRPPLEASTMLIQRVGRTPKERLCRQEVGFPDTAMTPFLKQCLTFLDMFLEVILEVSCKEEESEIPTMKMCEELWDGGPTGPPPLAELALTQHEVNYDLLHLHYQLVLMLHMLVSFNLKLARPLATLFDAAGQAALFTELSGRPRLPSHNPDAPLVTARTNFLCRVVSAGVQTVEMTDADSELLDASQAVHWLSHCLALGSAWSVTSDILRRHLICELYSNGYDRLAEEMIPAVSDKSLLASQLLLIVSQRMKHVIHSSPDLCGILSKVSPALSAWLQTMSEDQLKNMNSNLQDLASMLIPIMQYLSEEHQEYDLALNMVDAVHAFQDADASLK